MSKSKIDRYFGRRIRAILLAVSTPMFAWGLSTPVQAQCNPQQVAKLIASDTAASDVFGVSVSASGDTALVGAYFDDNANGINAGAAYVFVLSGGVWTQEDKLIAADGLSGDFFGYSVAIDGNTAVVGSRGDNAGSAYVFVRFDGVWTQQAKLTASDAEPGDKVGFSVAISGDTAVLGARGSGAGSAYVFVRSKEVWTQQAKLTHSDPEVDDFFGASVAISGDTVIVGAHMDDHERDSDAGSVYVFVRTGKQWTQQIKLTALDAAASDFFGYSIAMSGNTAVIGAFGDDIAGNTDAGSAYVFVRSGNVWFQQAKLVSSDTPFGDWFGWSVAIRGDTAIVGAQLDDIPGGNDAGSAYVFVRSNGFWFQQSKVTASDAAAADGFGYSVAVSGDTAVVGSVFDDHAGGTNAGSVYAYILGCDFDSDGVLNWGDACPNNTPGLPTSANGRPLRDCNDDCVVNGADIECIVSEILSQP